ncbi:MAG: BamA/TamA family outer membrane protein [Burkholderiales bacterium]|nr:BamA/TamA family outer membrane protein [Burkholderiales bacterium]
MIARLKNDAVPILMLAVLAVAGTATQACAQTATAEVVRSDVVTVPAQDVFVRFRVVQLNGSPLDLIKEHIPALSSDADPQIPTPALLRKLHQEIAGILATEGYFSPIIQFNKISDENRIDIQVDAGPRSHIKEVVITLRGDLQDAALAGDAQKTQLRDQLIQSWEMPKGEAFRQSDWSHAKTSLLENLKSRLYAGASLIDSRANVDTETNLVTLELDMESGAAFRFGDLQVSGLERYPRWLLDRFNPPKKGDDYSSVQLLEFQRALQNSAYFSSVVFNVEPDSTKADALPIEVALVEKQTRDFGWGGGYSSSTGLRTEVSYRDRNVLDKVWDLRSALRVEQKRQLSYADIYLPPSDAYKLDSFGVLVDRFNNEGVLQTRSAIGVKRTTTQGLIEQRLGINYTQEKVLVNENTALELERKSRALVVSAGWIWRHVDDVFAPTKGQRAQVDFAFSEKSLISDQRFLRAYGKYQVWVPVAKRDQLLLRAELGKVFSSGASGIPEDYLFRTGGSTSVRGYAYQSLGVKNGKAVVGGSAMLSSSIEYVHWNTETLGLALFADAGDAGKNWKEMRLKQSIGVGSRIKTPAGPIALDVAYGRQTRKIRLDFSIAIAF